MGGGQALLHLGLLEYSDALRARLASPEAQTLPAGDPCEVEIRAGSIWAVERLRRAWPTAAEPPLPILIDFFLWDYAVAHRGQLPGSPINRTRTLYY